ncbi:ricin B lectin domain-containing protein [Pilobolus umbonatus]|nr:ricin B lectin domain-containing protein [Pilobolus umbonatus]
MENFPPGYFYIKSRSSGKMVDVEGASKKSDTKIILWPPKYDEDRDNQLWYYQEGFIVSKFSGKVLDVRGGDLEDRAWICQYDRKLVIDAHNQRWGYQNGYLYILAEPHMVLDVRNQYVPDGSRLILNHKKFGHESVHQLWDLIPAGETRAERETLFEADFD